jgi:hypothetical protein
MSNTELSESLDPITPRLLEAWLVSGMSQTKFGYTYFGDPTFLSKARKGRRFRPSMIERIENVLKEYGV